MRILVTGGAGFIGSHIVDRLLAAEHRVAIVDDLSAGRAEQVPAGVTLHRLSILDPALPALCQGYDAVVHAAAQTSVAASVADPLHDATLNITGTIRTLQAVNAAGVPRLVYLSSAAVYGAPVTVPIDEQHPVAPSSPYGLSKLVAEQYVRLLGDAAGLGWFSLRLANVYGPRQSATGEAGVVARWCAALAAGRSSILEGDGQQTRDFISVLDVAAAVTRAVSAPVAGRVVNIGTGSAISIAGLLAELERLSGTAAVVERRPARVGDIRHSVLANATAANLLDWRPQVGLADGLAATVAWARQAQSAVPTR